MVLLIQSLVSIAAPLFGDLVAWRCNRVARGLGALEVRSNPRTHTYPGTYPTHIHPSIHPPIHPHNQSMSLIICSYVSFKPSNT
jgi:hypothetical protein